MPPSLIENDSKPLYEQVETVIRQRLLDNVYKPGVALRASTSSRRSSG